MSDYYENNRDPKTELVFLKALYMLCCSDEDVLENFLEGKKSCEWWRLGEDTMTWTHVLSDYKTLLQNEAHKHYKFYGTFLEKVYALLNLDKIQDEFKIDLNIIRDAKLELEDELRRLWGMNVNK